MYLDDGISRDSAPSEHVPQLGQTYGVAHNFQGICDTKAADKYCHVQIEQVRGSIIYM